MINEEGIKPDPERIESVHYMDTPQNVSNVLRFLGMVNQLWKFIPHLAEKTKNLSDSSKKLNSELSSTPVFAHYGPEKTTILSADASSFGLGAVLLQEQENKERKPVAYA